MEGGVGRRRHPLHRPHRRRRRLLRRDGPAGPLGRQGRDRRLRRRGRRWRPRAPTSSGRACSRRCAADEARDRRGRGQRDRGRHRDPPGHRHPDRGRGGQVRRVRGEVVALPDGRFGGSPRPSDPVRRGGRHPADRQAHHCGRGQGDIGLVEPGRARRHGARPRPGGRRDRRRQRTARGRGGPATLHETRG